MVRWDGFSFSQKLLVIIGKICVVKKSVISAVSSEYFPKIFPDEIPTSCHSKLKWLQAVNKKSKYGNIRRLWSR